MTSIGNFPGIVVAASLLRATHDVLHGTSKRCVVLMALATGLAWSAPFTQAAEMPWSNRPVKYVTVEPKDLRAFLREFAAQQGVAISIDPEVKGEITGRYELTPRSMLELLGRTFGLIWYFDGRVLYIYPATAVESDVIRLVDSTPAQFRQSLDRLGISDSRYRIAGDAGGNTVVVSGPRRFVELVRQAAVASDKGSGRSGDAATVTRVFPLSYAFAEDYTVQSGGRQMRIPGVASILRQSYGQDLRGGLITTSGRSAANSRAPLDPVGQAQDDAGAVPGTPVLPELPARRGGRAAAGSQSFDDMVADAPKSSASARGVPSFVADTRTNAVVVRDLPSRIDAYETLIRSLDQRPQLVELETSIIEVSTDAFDALGIDWRILNSNTQVELGSGNISAPIINPRGTTPDPNAVLAIPRTVGNVQGGVLSFITGNRTQLIARISALEQNGKAWVRAQPKITTLNNIEAVLESSNTFYVKVAGFQDARLFDVNVGTSVRITPSVVPGMRADGGTTVQTEDIVRLLIKIEDGAVTEQLVDQIPIVQRSSIGTQALVLNGATLLIAGYSQEREKQTHSGVPVLSSIPIVGNLFKSRGSSRTKVERLFMITPRLVQLQSPLPAGNRPAVPDGTPLVDPPPVSSIAPVSALPWRQSRQGAASLSTSNSQRPLEAP